MNRSFWYGAASIATMCAWIIGLVALFEFVTFPSRTLAVTVALVWTVVTLFWSFVFWINAEPK